jgi:cbb3-type cytochrome oxidase cytochrome c subunit
VKWIPAQYAPKLMDIGGRVSVDWLQNNLAAPDETVAGTMMLDLLHGNREQPEARIHDLISLGKPGLRRVMPDRAAVARGESIYHRVGCVACDAPQSDAAISPDSVPLPVIEDFRRAGG